MVNAFLEYYRCPDQLVDFGLTKEPSGDAGYFQWRDHTVCFGRSAAGQNSPSCEGDLPNLSDDIRFDQGKCLLPFRPDEVIDNLRLERYAVNRPASLCGRLARTAYYAIRPILPVGMRKHLQGASLRLRNRESFPAWPVDFTVDTVMQQLVLLSLRSKGIDRLPFIWFWPKGFSSCAIVTHDVETAVGRDLCPRLMDINDRFEIKSSFQVVPERRYSVSPPLMAGMRSRGFEVNVHDLNHDGRLYRDRDLFEQRAVKINFYLEQFEARGFRSAALYRNLEWYDALSCAYDMSVPSSGRLEAQGGGCCTALPYFVGKILELPLTTTQDYSLFHILKLHSLELWQHQIASIMEHHGLISFIVHPDYLNTFESEGTYLALLQELSNLRSQAGLWIALPSDVNTWWRQRQQMRLVPSGDRWRITGPGSEKASLANALVVGDRVTYVLD